MSDTTRILEHIERLRAELDQLEKLVRGEDGIAPNLIEPVIDGEIIFDVESELEVVGGIPTTKFPECCAVGNQVRYSCTGTLIAPTLVITAKHCEHMSRVFFGANVNEPQKGEMIEVVQDIRHPDPNVDIRVLVLQRPALATPRHVAQGTEVGNPHTAVVAGFGTTDLAGTTGYGIKRRARVPIKSLGCTSPADQQLYGCHADFELIAGHLGLYRDTCKGDSGGPLYISDPNGNGDFLLGVTSRGTNNAQHMCGDGGIYIRADRFLDWIRTATGINVEGPLP